jgi:hypothetical protein
MVTETVRMHDFSPAPDRLELRAEEFHECVDEILVCARRIHIDHRLQQPESFGLMLSETA